MKRSIFLLSGLLLLTLPVLGVIAPEETAHALQNIWRGVGSAVGFTRTAEVPQIESHARYTVSGNPKMQELSDEQGGSFSKTRFHTYQAPAPKRASKPSSLRRAKPGAVAGYVPGVKKDRTSLDRSKRRRIVKSCPYR